MNIQQKRTKGAMTSHTELSWTMPEMRTMAGKRSTWLGNSLFFFLSQHLCPRKRAKYTFLAVTLDYFGDTSLSWLAGRLCSEPLFSPELNRIYHRNNLLLPVKKKKKIALFPFLQTQLTAVLGKNRPKVQDCGLADSVSPAKVAHLDCFVTFFPFKTIPLRNKSLYHCRCAKQKKILLLGPRGRERNREIHTKGTGSTRAAKDAAMTSVEGEQRGMYYLGRMPNADKRLHHTPSLSL